jgi:hypothetical protein
MQTGYTTVFRENLGHRLRQGFVGETPKAGHGSKFKVQRFTVAVFRLGNANFSNLEP